ncbi:MULTISPECIES: TatD family hydrolase [unclassified Colwellia]|uniref:TatD family hydrolase n=1 Tax=unclassified Colwellia TaxID=196834 RepID=UPI0015F4670B|nr:MULTISPECIES: TatD family hydrolase [unclassified Colwellia]MBA6230831.1 TatD family hydrolase [Colwellia sp. MB02u-7]MBA6234762.1 TatD family hydrolase [Colwellia sp. MB02u-11]MBA6255625.1 TatD family hydrolase [Colwellia sp. MB3u-28]MBA6261766.1 TatD family hydrolase [Colwellia sp. MB3u-41]MBA6301317.1 TatD family hydrolase [Colwellia sp. MB3u-22]
MRFTDSHCHLDFKAFTAKGASSTVSLLALCAKKNIHQIIVPSVAPDNWESVLALTNNIQEQRLNSCKVFSCLGIHPWFLGGLQQQHLDKLAQKVLENKTRIIAIGEAGLDGVIAKQQDNFNQQNLFFEFQLYLAQRHQLPIIVHHRRTHNEIITLLKQVKIAHGGIIHAFSGSYQQACQYIDLGFKLGIGGTITYPRAEKTIAAIKRLPLSSLVLETDAPSMPLNGFQGENNSPLRIVNVFNKLVELRQESSEEIADEIENNISSLFQLNDKNRIN